MQRLIFVPQYPTKMRYQEWWLSEFPRQFRKYFDEVIVIGKEYLKNIILSRGESENFSPINENIKFECAQIDEYLSLKLLDNDILFLADISFAGVFASTLYHKSCSKMYAFCHATSINLYDYFTKFSVSKFKVETGHSHLFNKVFVGSKYSAKKVGWKNTKVVALPHPPSDIVNPFPYIPKMHNIVSVCRPSFQKVNEETEKEVEKIYGKIERQMFDNWHCYSKFLSSSKILLITSKEDTFNYTIMDAIKCRCIPIAPNDLCFPEILPKEYLYNDIDDLLKKIDNALNEKVDIPVMLCKDKVDDFYRNICETMLRR